MKKKIYKYIQISPSRAYLLIGFLYDIGTTASYRMAEFLEDKLERVELKKNK